MILKKLWDDYFKSCFPQGCHPVQEQELHQAFFAGTLAAFAAIDQLPANAPDSAVTIHIQMVVKEAQETCDANNNRNHEQQDKGQRI